MQPSPPTWPEADAKRIAELTADGRGLADLWEASPVRFDSNAPRAEELIATLFPGNPLLCIGDPCILPDGSPSQTFDTKPHEAWRGDIARHSLIVPSPMSNVWGRRKSDGKPSKHTLDNTGPRRFLVIEFDNGSLDSQASRIFHLASKAPLALVTHSGSKSLHSWFYCQGQAENSLHRFMRYAVTIGADKATWLRSQFVRVPDGTRDDGRAQRAYFFNPQVIKA
jgi:hypothetical protein